MLKGHLILLSQAAREKLQVVAAALKINLHMKILSRCGQNRGNASAYSKSSKG